jgi:hypothetical protein
MACSKCRAFPEDKKLSRSIEELKLVLFDAIPCLVDILRPESFCEQQLYPNFISLPSYSLVVIVTKITSPLRGFRADELLSRIHRSSKKVENLARDLQDNLAVETYYDAEIIKETTRNTEVHVKEIKESITAVGKDIRELNVWQEERMDSHMEELKQFCARQIEDALASQNGLFHMLKDVVSGNSMLPMTIEGENSDFFLL